MALATIREVTLGDLTAVSNGTAVDISDLDEAWVQVGGTFVGTWVVQVSFDGGTTWTTHATGTTPTTTAVLPRCRKTRLICSAFTSGTIAGRLSGHDKQRPQ